MSITEAFEKYWEARTLNYAYAGGLLSVVRTRMKEAFTAGYGSGYNARIDDEKEKGRPGNVLGLEEEVKVACRDGFAVFEDKDLYAVANRIKPWIKDWIQTKVVVPATPPTTNDPKTPAMIRFTNAGGTFEKHFTPAKGWHWVRVNPPPADPKAAIGNAIQVDENGLVKLSDADVRRIAQATVNHARAVEAEVAQRQLEHQKREMEERARLQEIVRTASEYAVGTGKQTQSQARVEIALEDVRKYFEALDTQSAGSRLPAWKDAVKSLITAIKILNERK